MAETKTKPTKASVEDFLESVADEQAKKDSYALIALMKKITGCPAVMWGTAIIGFDSYHYKYDSGREGDICLIGFSPRKGKIALYLSSFEGRNELLSKLGKHQTGKGCLYIKKLSDINVELLERIITRSIESLKGKLAAFKPVEKK
jgi:hypothetical protein